MAHSTTSNLSAQDFFTTTLNGNVSNTDTVINLNAVPTASEGYLIIDPNNVSTREIIYYTSKSAGAVTTPDATANSGRGVGGTSVVAHTSGTLVEMREVAEYWLALQNGQSLAAGAISATNLATASVTGSKISTSAILGGYGAVTGSNFSTSSTTAVQITGATVTITVPAGGRSVKLTGWLPSFGTASGNGTIALSLWDGVVGVGTLLATTTIILVTTQQPGGPVMAVVTPAAGSKTYNLGISTSTSSVTAAVGSFILAEII